MLVAAALTVTAAPAVINTVALIATFVSPGPPNYSPSLPYNLSSDIFPGPFSVTVRTDSGGNWLSATPSTGTAPAVVTVSATFTGLARGRYSGEVIVTGSGNTMVIPASALISGGVQLRADYPLRFAVRAGDPAPPAQIASVVPECIDIVCPPNPVAAGLPFAVLRAYRGTDLPAHNPRIKCVDCPFTGERLAAVPAIRGAPDVETRSASRNGATRGATTVRPPGPKTWR